MSRRPSTRVGSALISTLLAIVVLTIIVTAFLQSMTTERRTAQSYLNNYRAKLAAQTAASAAIEIVRSTISQHPDSVTFWSPNGATGSDPLPVTSIYYYDSPAVLDPTTAPDPSFRPLVSGASTGTFPAEPSSVIPTANGTIDINTERFGTDGDLWIGEFPNTSQTFTANGSSQINVPWILLRETDATTGPISSRYAFWVEDESFRTNLRTSGTDLRGSDSSGSSPSEIPLQGVASAAKEVTSAPGIDPNIFSTGVLAVREAVGEVPTNSTINQEINADLSPLKALITTNSEGSELSRTGARRLDLNDSSIITTSTDPATIRRQLDVLIETIKSQAPDFGRRFLAQPSANPSDVQKTIYLNKVAANLRDYIDADHQPTIISANSGNVDIARPNTAIGTLNGTNPYWAIGKEAGPRLQETVLHIRQDPGMSGSGSQDSEWKIQIAYYLEFWNPTAKDITVQDLESSPGAGDAFVKILNQPGWEDAGDGRTVIQSTPSRDMTIDLSLFKNAQGEDLVFRAGETTVLTTDPNPETIVGPTGANLIKTRGEADAMFRVSGFHQTYSHQTNGKLSRNNKSSYGGNPTLQLLTRDGNATSPFNPGADYQTEVILGNNLGYFDSAIQPVPINPGILVDAFGSKSNQLFFHFRGGSLLGNTGLNGSNYAPNYYGDPLASLDGLRFTANTRFQNWRDTSRRQNQFDSGQASTLGKANSNTIVPDGWPEGTAKTLNSLANGGAPYTTADEPLDSIGELGNVIDPRKADLDTPGGGRTFRIGQPERTADRPLWDGKHASTTKHNAAFRLTDIFSTRSAISTAGLININGALRDGGATVRAALAGLAFANQDSALGSVRGGQAFSEDEVTQFISSLEKRLLNEDEDGESLGLRPPFFERGELSELRFFAEGTMGNSAQSDVRDRGREELFSRLVGLTTTRGTVFTVYAVGQALYPTQTPTSPPQVLSTATARVTFRLVPRFASTSNTFDPTSSDSISQRFSPPTDYDVQILSASYQ